MKKTQTNAATRAKRKYNRQNYYQISLMLPKEMEDRLKDYVKEHDTTINGFITKCVSKALDSPNLTLKAKRDPNPNIKKFKGLLYNANNQWQSEQQEQET